ncbi:MAG: 2,3-bisphosphoglycerate-independent phosphoglycerate mutase [Rickettsiales bacterium]|jgi:2,3-bisphosphoglycerate-independent phosphoglycerate mutase|nr:2,3-bisphosphoglycerate-independent phosphoglycerate mutase [Rickettsiales bacterium]
MKKPFILCILDGWGHRAETAGNAIELGHTPNWHRMLATYPHNLLEASGTAVGLPSGQMGNSEVGHMNIGAGRVAAQLLGQIEKAAGDGSLAQNEHMKAFIGAMKASGGTAHVWGMVSPGGVHSHSDHIIAIAGALSASGIPVALHIATDGRDVPPKSAAGFVTDFQKRLPGAYIATISGRYYAMDRNKSWDRTKLAYDAMASGEGPRFSDPAQAIRAAYAAGVTDEFIIPSVEEKYEGMKDGDGLVIANFRADRVRQIAAALADPAFSGFERRRTAKFAAALGLAEYSAELNSFYRTIFPPQRLSNILGEVLSKNNLKQLRIAETEKYAHVTFFFNGGEERVYPGEERILIPSPKVATYDLKPEMSAREITDTIESRAGEFDAIVVNYANGDMVGHTGIEAAAEKAAAAVDECIGRLERLILNTGGAMLITADHGNCETMIDENGGPMTAHTTNPVECIAIGTSAKALRPGRLADIAPTILKILGISKPAEMTGEELF